MKTLIFLIVTAALISMFIRKMRKSQAEATLARQKSFKHRKEQALESLTPADYSVWPVVGMAAAEEDSPGEEGDIEEPSMTTIEYKPPEQLAS